MDKSYRELFFGESEEYLNQINVCLVALEKNPADVVSLNEIFRLMHTLKGMAATMGFNDLAEFTHKIEDTFDLLRSGEKKVTPKIMDVIFPCIDTISTILDALRDNRDYSVDIYKHISALEKVMAVGESARKEKKPEEIPGKTVADEGLSVEEKNILDKKTKEGFDVFKVDIHLAKDCPMKEARAFLVIIRLGQMGQVLKTIPSEAELKKGNFDYVFSAILVTKEDKKVIKDELERVLEIAEIRIEPVQYFGITAGSKAKEASSKYLKKIQSMRIRVERLDKIMNFMGELSIAKSRLVQTLQSKDSVGLEEAVLIVDRLVSSLQDEILQMRLLPISFILDTFPRIVRDLARKFNKDIDLKIVGSEIELDRIVLDEIGDPLVHIIRNAIDHGMEDKETRRKMGKNPKGKIEIKVSRDKGHVIIEVKDDGRGVDFKKVVEKAKEKGLSTENELLNVDANQILEIMTLPGFSTSAKVTDISGRGVGLDVVKSKLDSLGGRLDFETELNKGTKFILILPLTLAIIKAMLVGVGKQIFAIPIMSIRESVKIKAEEIKSIQEKEVIRIRDEIIPLIRLDEELGIAYEDDLKSLSVVIVEGRIKSLGLFVNRIIGEQDIVVKPLGFVVKKIRGIAGATILGDGTVALILDIINIK